MNLSWRIVLLLAAVAAAAADNPPGVALPATEIHAVLANNTAQYDDGAKQFFAADGRTHYQTADGQLSSGTWWASDNQYCSRWNPGGSACYIITRHHDAPEKPRLRWNGKYPATIYPGDLIAAEK